MAVSADEYNGTQNIFASYLFSSRPVCGYLVLTPGDRCHSSFVFCDCDNHYTQCARDLAPGKEKVVQDISFLACILWRSGRLCIDRMDGDPKNYYPGKIAHHATSRVFGPA